MPELYALSESDVAILKQVVSEFKRRRKTATGRFPSERTHVEGDDQMAPEVYVAEVPGAIPGLIVRGDTGTGAGDLDYPGEAECQIYTIVEEDWDTGTDTPPRLQPMGDLTRRLYNISEQAVTSPWTLAVRTKGGRWIAIPMGVGMKRVCLAEDHPGYGIVFTAYLGEWDPDTDSWDYGESEDEATLVHCIDYWYSISGPYPGEGATGLAIPQSSTTYETLYEMVTMDCDSPGVCFESTGTGTGTGTAS